MCRWHQLTIHEKAVIMITTISVIDTVKTILTITKTTANDDPIVKHDLRHQTTIMIMLTMMLTMMPIPKDNHYHHYNQGVERRDIVSEHCSTTRDWEVRWENAQLCWTAEEAEGSLNFTFYVTLDVQCVCQYINIVVVIVIVAIWTTVIFQLGFCSDLCTQYHTLDLNFKLKNLN